MCTFGWVAAACIDWPQPVGLHWRVPVLTGCRSGVCWRVPASGLGAVVFHLWGCTGECQYSQVGGDGPVAKGHGAVSRTAAPHSLSTVKPCSTCLRSGEIKMVTHIYDLAVPRGLRYIIRVSVWQAWVTRYYTASSGLCWVPSWIQWILGAPWDPSGFMGFIGVHGTQWVVWGLRREKGSRGLFPQPMSLGPRSPWHGIAILAQGLGLGPGLSPVRSLGSCV